MAAPASESKGDLPALTAADTARYTTAFQAIDADKSGTLSPAEIKTLFGNLNEHVDDEGIAKLIKEVDTSNDGAISLSEFLKMMAHRRSTILKGFVTRHKDLSVRKGFAGSHSFSEEEQAAFVDHINRTLEDDEYLKSAGVVPIEAAGPGLYEAVSRGILLCKLINKAQPDAIDERALNYPKKGKPLNPWELKENLNLTINAAKSIGCIIINIHANDLMHSLKEGKEYLVLALIWQIVKIQLLNNINLRDTPALVKLLQPDEDLGALMKLPPEQILLRWFNYHLAKAGSDKVVNNFAGDVKDASAFWTLLCRLEGTEEEAAADAGARADAVVDKAKKMGIPVFLKGKDITSANRRLNLGFAATIFNTNHGLELGEEEQKKVEAEFEAAGIIDDDEGDSREERVFRMWMNSLGFDEHLNNLFTDVEDAKPLLSTLDRLAPGSVNWKKVNKLKMNRYKQIENANYAIQLGKEMGMSLVGIGGVDIVDGKKKLILAYTWQLMRTNVVRTLEDLGGGKRVNDADIIKWANNQVEMIEKETRIKSFRDKSVGNGLFLLDLLSSIEPRAINPDLVTPGESEDDRRNNAKYVISVARKIGAQIFLTWEDITEVKPKMVMTLLASIMLVATTYAKGK